MGLNFKIMGRMMPYLVDKKQNGQNSMLELGAQVFSGWRNVKHTYVKGKVRYPLLTGKQIFSEIGFRHVSVDLKGAMGSKRCDLTRLLPRALHSKFDIVTNIGVSEYIQDQYMVFKNMHVSAREDAIFFHVLPDNDRIPDRGLFYYVWEFMPYLAKLCGYKIIEHSQAKRLIITAMCKNESKTFIPRIAFNQLPVYSHDKNQTERGAGDEQS
jgi:hypothetical protein